MNVFNPINFRIMNTRNVLFLAILMINLTLVSCDPADFLSRKPDNVIGKKNFFQDAKLVRSNVADLYNRIGQWYGINQWWQFAQFDHVFPSNFADYWRVKNQTWSYANWRYWDTNYLHDLNMFTERIKKAEQIASEKRKRFQGEVLFLRAHFYFKWVRSMGGVPILLQTLEYDYSGDASYLYRKRAPEAKVYDLVIREADSAAHMLPKDPTIKSRATWGAAMTLKSTAALFAGSIAQHGTTTPTVSLKNNIVGIPADKAEHYYKIALNTAQKIIKSGRYHLYKKYPNNLSKNFTQLFLDKNNNPEAIFVKDHKLDVKTTSFTVLNQPHSIAREAASNGMMNPTLNFVQSFEKLNGSYAPFDIKNPDGTYKRYDQKGDIFKNRDARLAGTVILPGSTFWDKELDIWAGWYLPERPKGERIITGSQFGQRKTLPNGEAVQVVGTDGPIDKKQHGTQTGFYVRKYLDPDPAAGEIGTKSDVWWIYYRYAQVLLNAAEAAFQLEKKALAAKYLNKIRARAGLKPLTPGQITFKQIVHAWSSEFAFEGKRLWNMKRWRLAHKIWNGGKTDLEHPKNPLASSTQPWGLWPYKVYHPGHPDHGKWIFMRVLPSVVSAKDNFRLGNYYSSISNNVLSHNPKLIQNPNQ